MNSNAVALLLFVALAVCIGDSAEIPPLPVQDEQTAGASSAEPEECKFAVLWCVIINFFLRTRVPPLVRGGKLGCLGTQLLMGRAGVLVEHCTCPLLGAGFVAFVWTRCDDYLECP